MTLFWADQLAEKAIERAKKEGQPVSIKCQQTPSGGKHIGNLNDVLRAYFVCLGVKDKGYPCKFIHTTDDRDPLKNVPGRIADLEGNWHNTDKTTFNEYLGKSLFLIPDPFKCCSSWAEHFTKVWMKGLEMLNVNVELYSVNKLYEEGRFEPYIEKVFKNREVVSEIISKYQTSKSKGYIPFDAICPKCGRLANVDDVDIENKKVHFVCGGKSIKDKKSEGCGYEGWVPWSQGKLQWRFEWPALWCIFNTTFEPFGKDHAEGSWPSGKEIIKRVYGREPPIPFVYEFFLVDGKKMSASQGNVYIVQDILKVIEPEVFMYYYTKRPEKQRDFELAHIYRLVDEFDDAERIYFNVDNTAYSEQKKESIKRMYQMTMHLNPPKKYISKPSYAFCATLIQILDEDNAIKRLRELGHVNDENEDVARRRLQLAKNWIELYADDSYKIKLLTIEESEKIKKNLPNNVKIALAEFSDKLNLSEDEQIRVIKEICEKHDIKPKEFFEGAYTILLGKNKGPRLIPFINSLNKGKVKELLS
ncbi:lysine--tRNA ligase [Candidatus Micrarchaeota archaeon]|nr:lysine--tRNA ligase [Candidatus Micrarchaeota archaeon]